MLRPPPAQDAREFEIDGIRYLWDGWRWRPAEGRVPLAREVLRHLNRLRARSTRNAEHELTDAGVLIGLAIKARQTDAPGRAERYARRVLVIAPDNPIAGAILSSVLREKGKPKLALEVADHFVESRHPQVLTSRSAALCDIGRWAEAAEQIDRVLQIELADSGFNSEEALAVESRVKGHASREISP